MEQQIDMKVEGEFLLNYSLKPKHTDLEGNLIICYYLFTSTEIIQTMRTRGEDPDLLYVIKSLTAEDMPGLPPGGGITSKWEWAVITLTRSGINTGESKHESVSLPFLSMQARLYHLCISEVYNHPEDSGADGELHVILL